VKNPNDPEAILYAFAVEPTQDRKTLERYLRQFPELAEELIDLASELRFSEVTNPASVDSIIDSGSQAAWEEFIGCEPKVASAVGAVDLFATFRGAAFVGLAQALNVPRSFLTGLRDGLVTATSVPERFVHRLAREMSVSVELIREHFAHPRTALVARAFKSDDKPSHQGQISFRELIQNTEMTDEQRQILIQDCDGDGLA